MTAQFAGGVPAMCDGVTQGQKGMELSLFSRDVIAMATAVSMSHDMFDGTICMGVCDKIVPGLLHHNWRPVQFTLVIDSFGIKYVKENHTKHLISVLEEQY